MKVWTVEWHGDYDGGSVDSIYDSPEKAYSRLKDIQNSGRKNNAYYDKVRRRLLPLMPKNPGLVNSKGDVIESAHIAKWNTAWNKWMKKVPPSEFQYTWKDYSIFDYEVK